jgi:hypothetical protein
LQSSVWLWDRFGITHYRVSRIVDDNIDTAKLLYGSGQGFEDGVFGSDVERQLENVGIVGNMREQRNIPSGCNNTVACFIYRARQRLAQA